MASQGDRQIKLLIAANLDRGITRKGWTNREVGEKIGKTEHAIWRWRRGKHTPSLEAMSALADLLFDGDIAAFYTDHDQIAA